MITAKFGQFLTLATGRSMERQDDRCPPASEWEWDLRNGPRYALGAALLNPLAVWRQSHRVELPRC